MSTSKLDPALPGDASITLRDAHRPALLSGDYRLSHKLTMRVPGARVDFEAGSTAEGEPGFKPQAFSVRGPRFSLSPDEIHSTFPPDLARGDFSAYLPHIALRRSTLPWERSGVPEVQTDTPPWMALLVLDPAEIVATEVVPVSSALDRIGLASEAAEDARSDEQVKLVTLTHDVASSRLPDVATLHLGAHVRTAVAEGMTVETAIVVAARRPRGVTGETTRSVLHLVSLEDRYPKEAVGETLPDIGTGTVTLVSLATWEILNDVPQHGFRELLTPIASERTEHLGLPAPDGVAPVPATLMAAGWVPLPHHLREGSRTLCWYHGPLVGDRAALPDVALPRPAVTADALNIVLKSQGMLDVAYASAWQLGRSLMLARPQIARDLAQWKRADDAAGHAARALAEHAHLPHAIAPPPPPRLNAVGAFFRDDLAGLGAVPFRYLVPDEGLLPVESLRFFDVDKAWIRCLLDGAFSVGRATSGDLQRDANRDHVLPDIRAVSGFLLRSAAVSGFPGLLFEGFEERIAGTGTRAPESHKALEVVHAEKLGPNTLLVLFAGPLVTLDFHLHVQAMHFSLPPKAPVHDRGHIDLTKLAQDLGLDDDSDSDDRKINSANLARRLLRGLPLIRIERQTPR